MAEPPPSNLRPMRPVQRTPFDEQVLPVSGAEARQTTPLPAPGWNTACVLKILCPKDNAVVDKLSRTTLNVADSISFDDPYYNGKKWTTKHFDARGTSDAGQKQIGILSGTSCEEAATTFYLDFTDARRRAALGASAGARADYVSTLRRRRAQSWDAGT